MNNCHTAHLQDIGIYDVAVTALVADRVVWQFFPAEQMLGNVSYT